jgi:glutamate N-acetyltransferase/amino-acid N-acetyltransferase
MTYNTPQGFSFAVAEAAIKKPGRKDLALIASEKEAIVSALFTTNAIKAAPVLVDIKRARSGIGRAIIVNSGNANACTGPQGLRDAEEMAALVANALGLRPSEVYVCSTGVIGAPMPMDRIRAAIKPLVLSLTNGTLHNVAEAIMTTDTFAKVSTRVIEIEGKKATISAIAKGAGMICPNMATMLCFILTDIAVTKKALDRALKDAVQCSFNSITIDGDMSTNDTVLAFANGMAQNRPIEYRGKDYETFCNCLSEICLELAKMIVKDGEGATKFITIDVINAKDNSDAKMAAYCIANSMLVKTALYGNDANWGRIMAALGYAGVSLKADRVDISINGIEIAHHGLTTGRDAEAQHSMAGSSDIHLMVDLNLGRAKGRVFTCDLTEGYVKVNAEYRT